MPADGVMRQGARGLGQNHREGDESERLPKFGNFEPDQKCDEGRARRRKETTEGALRKIVSLGCEPGRQIKHGAENRQSQQAHAHMRVWSFEMQVDRRCAEECEEAKQRVLHLEMARFERFSHRSQGQHERGERHRGPILGEERPSRRASGKRTEIGMDRQKRPIGRTLKEFPPACADGKVIEVKHHGAESEEGPGGRLQPFAMAPQIHQVAEVESDEPNANEKSGKQPQPAEDYFLHHCAGRTSVPTSQRIAMWLSV